MRNFINLIENAQRLDELSIDDFRGGDGGGDGHHVIAYDIEWDTDGEEADLPETETIVVHGDPSDLSEEISDLLSDHFGYCISSFKWKLI